MKAIMNVKKDFASILSLFSSFSTLICCALPTLLVTLGMGAVVAGVISSFPGLVSLSRHKIWVFAIVGIVIAVNFWLLYGKKGKENACEIPGDGSESACDTASRWSKIILWISAGIYVIGIFMAFIYFPLRQGLGI